MKQLQYKISILIILLSVAFSGCRDEVYESFKGLSPIYMSYDDLRDAVQMTTTREIEKPGKIYFKDNYLFINEIMEGVHVVDVTDPSNPNKIGFIEIPGNVDIAIKEDVLYADSYVDLVAMDVSDLNNVTEVGRIEDIFPYMLPEYEEGHRMGDVDRDKGVVVDWEIITIKQELEPVVHYYPVYRNKFYLNEGTFDLANYATTASGVGGGSGTTYGVGGSMARFGLYKDYLYTIDDNTLYAFGIQNLDSPEELSKQGIGWGVETMFIYNHHMFLGTRNGMLIYSLEIENSPKYVKNYRHITSCDPVVVQGNLAYVTLHDGGACGRSVNRLDVIEMNSDYSELDLMVSHSMANPHGLGIDGDILFVCDGDAGLKVFNASDPMTIPENKLAEFPDINTYDVIPLNDYLFMIGDGGFYLYDYSDIQNIHLLSTIPVSTGS